MIHDTQSAQISRKQDERNIYAIMKTMCLPGYHHNGFVATHALGHMMYGYTLLVPMNQRVLNKQGAQYAHLAFFLYIHIYLCIYQNTSKMRITMETELSL